MDALDFVRGVVVFAALAIVTGMLHRAGSDAWEAIKRKRR